MKRSVLKGIAFVGATKLNRNQLKAIRGGQAESEQGGQRCANTGAVCWFNGENDESVVGKCEEMGSGQCRCVVRDKGGSATESIPFQECLG